MSALSVQRLDMSGRTPCGICGDPDGHPLEAGDELRERLAAHVTAVCPRCRSVRTRKDGRERNFAEHDEAWKERRRQLAERGEEPLEVKLRRLPSHRRKRRRR